MKLAAEVPWWVRGVIRKLGQTSTILVVIVLLALSVVVGAALVTITGVGLEAVAPDASLSRVTSAIVLLLARIFFGMFTAAIASALINRLLIESKGMGDVALRNHTVICGWNGRGNKIVQQLAKDERVQDVVIVASAHVGSSRHLQRHQRPVDVRRGQRDSRHTLPSVVDWPGVR